ncbi:esterase/lipase family protein [Streptomyces sp. GMR22]|uniref:esterase/lipase family protein n=1 Tax=Streptomyces sp. GMR22 TaxID=2759524 RepID=UPI0015FC2F8B|nr:alpha/beta fold hydrolase [Streptomyces sp. GMR22]MBA6439777.1 alpha/beta fold hydrolase [Streptomyces sp. GMR22]
MSLTSAEGAQMTSDGGKLGVVFVHGFRSGPSMWDSFVELIANDPDLGFVSPLLFRYSTALRTFHPLRRIPTFDNVADSLKEYLDTEGREFQNLTLVSHSQGGLVVQRYLARMLNEGRGKDVSRIRRIVMFACPNNGSDIGLSLRRRWIPFNPQEQQLRPLDEQVTETQRIVINQVVNAAQISGHSCRIPIQAYAGETDKIVTPSSARSVFADAAVLPGDHFTIVRPDSRQHRSYTALKRQLTMAKSNGPPVETINTLKAETLEVHVAVSPGDAENAAISLTPYLTRAHDELLRQALKRAIDGGPSIFATLTGDSSTGKTRALYEALRKMAPDRPLLRPTSSDHLLAQIEGGLLVSGSVLWLNETQRFLYGSSGERVAAELRSRLERQNGVTVVGTLWTDPYWNELTALGVSEDPHGKARSLLTHPTLAVRIPVSAELSGEDRSRCKDLVQACGDSRLSQALDAGASDGRVIQHLSGGPELLRAFIDGPGIHFTPVEHAIISAALDARRLGHRRPIEADLLAEAADGALDPRHRSADPHWAVEALRALSMGARSDGTRTDIRNALAPLAPHFVRSGTPASYEPADYLDQHTRSRRADQLGSPSLWDALVEHAHDPDDLDRLADAAWKRGLYKVSFRLARKAILAGHPTASGDLVRRLNSTLDPKSLGLEWIASHTVLTDPATAARLISHFRASRARKALATLLNRDPGAHANLDDPFAVAQLIRSLMKNGTKGAASRLAARNPADYVTASDPRATAQLFTSLRKVDEEQASTVLDQLIAVSQGDTGAIAYRIGQLRSAGAIQEISRLLDLNPTSKVDLRNSGALAQLIGALRKNGAYDSLSVLLARDIVECVNLQDARGVIQLIAQLRQTGGAEETASYLALRWADHVDVRDPRLVAQLLREFRSLGASGAVAALLARDPINHVRVNSAYAVSELFSELRELGEYGAIDDLGNRLVSNMASRDPGAIASLLRVLQPAGADSAIAALLEREPEKQVRLGNAGDVAQLVKQLGAVSADSAIAALLEREPEKQVKLENPGDVAQLIRQLRAVSADKAIAALLARKPETHGSVTNARAVRRLIKQLRQAGAVQATATLTRRAMDSGAELPERYKTYGREADGLAADPWCWDQIFD